MVEALMLRQIGPNTTLEEFFRQLREGARHLFASEVDVAAAATTSVQSFAHSLGYAYHGAEVVYQDQPVAFFVRPPSSGAEPHKRVYFVLGAATAVNLRVRVY
jgi:hypothetical protein